MEDCEVLLFQYIASSLERAGTVTGRIRSREVDASDCSTQVTTLTQAFPQCMQDFQWDELLKSLYYSWRCDSCIVT